MRGNQEDTSAFNTHFQSGRFSHSRKVLTSDGAITVNGSLVNFFKASGADRNVYLPEFEDGRFYVASNVGVVNLVVMRDSLGTLVTTLLPGDTALLFASKSEWVALRGWAALAVFTNTINGLVPAPNSVTPGSLFLRDDGQWAQVQVTGIVDAFKFITDGTNTAIGSGPDTFRLRSSTNKIGITVTNNEAVFGDNANFTVLEAAVDHNALLNFVADKHVAHTGVNLTAGLGISGGGDIAASRTFDFAPSELTANAAPVLTDYCVMDLAAGGPRRTLFSALNGILDHNSLLNYVADRHIAHSGVSIVAGSGITGGGDITTSRTLSLDINGLTVDVPAVGDFIPFFDISGVDNNKVTVANLNAAFDHNSLLNYVADQHVAHSGVTLTAGNGLTGGGTIAASRTFDVGAGVGILSNANDVALDTTHSRNVDHSSANLTIRSNISGGVANDSANTLTATIDAIIGSTRGMILVRGSASWQSLALGANTTVLKSNGTDPVWGAGGAGDLVAANNLSDVANVQTARSNLGIIGAVKQQKFTATGTYTPSTGMLYCIIELVGGGGAGGGVAGGTTVCDAGGGGGSGSHSRLTATAATIGASKAVTIGAGGTPGAAGNNPGGAGGDTSVGTICIGKGGSGGLGQTGGRAGQGGAGGIAGTGDDAIAGNPGMMGIGGASTIFTVYGGAGAPSFFGGAGQSLVRSTNGGQAGSAGTMGGGGSGGVVLNSATNVAGGAGGDGYVRITEFCTTP